MEIKRKEISFLVTNYCGIQVDDLVSTPGCRRRQPDSIDPTNYNLCKVGVQSETWAPSDNLLWIISSSNSDPSRQLIGTLRLFITEPYNKTESLPEVCCILVYTLIALVALKSTLLIFLFSPQKSFRDLLNEPLVKSTNITVEYGT